MRLRLQSAATYTAWSLHRDTKGRLLPLAAALGRAGQPSERVGAPVAQTRGSPARPWSTEGSGSAHLARSPPLRLQPDTTLATAPQGAPNSPLAAHTAPHSPPGFTQLSIQLPGPLPCGLARPLAGARLCSSASARQVAFLRHLRALALMAWRPHAEGHLALRVDAVATRENPRC